jgi:hypothetical protein
VNKADILGRFAIPISRYYMPGIDSTLFFYTLNPLQGSMIGIEGSGICPFEVRSEWKSKLPLKNTETIRNFFVMRAFLSSPALFGLKTDNSQRLGQSGGGRG